MTHTLRVPLLSASMLLTLAVGCGPGPEGASPEGEPDLSAASHEIIGGKRESGYSGVAMLYHDYGYLCSGTIIDDRVFLTAGHCLETTNPGHYTVYGGTDLNNDEPEWFRFAEEVHAHPQLVLTDTNIDHDVAVVILNEDAPVTPYRWLDSDPDDEIYQKGTEFTAVGYGITNGGGSGDGIKRSVTLNVDEVYSNIFTYGTSSVNTCSGDSGGPAVAEVGGYLTVIGVVSFGDYDCSQYGADMRTDDNKSFIDNYAAPDAGRARVGGAGGGDDSPIACSVATTGSRSPLAAAVLALIAFAGIVTRRR